MSAEMNGIRPDQSRLVVIPAGSVSLEGELSVPDAPHGLVIFAQAASDCRHCEKLQSIARRLRDARLGTLILDLLTPEEDVDYVGKHLRFNMGLLTQRLICAAQWLAGEDEARHLRLGFLGFDTGAGAALVAAADIPDQIAAVVVQSGRVDLAGGALRRVKCPTLLIVDTPDQTIVELNRETNELLPCEKKLVTRGASTTAAKENAATREDSVRLMAAWFDTHLTASGRSRLHRHDLRR